MKKKDIIFLLAGIALIIGLADSPYSYSELLKIFICGAGIFGAYLGHQNKQIKWVWILGGAALMYNPFFKANLGEDAYGAWGAINRIAGFTFILYSCKDIKIREIIKNRRNIKNKAIATLRKLNNIDRKWKICIGTGLCVLLILLIGLAGRNVALKNFNNFLMRGTPWQATLAIKAGADVNAVAYYRYGSEPFTPLMWAAAYNSNPEIIKILVKSGARVNDTVKTGPLIDLRVVSALMMAAADNSNPEIIKVLVRLGADVNARDSKGKTPLMYAADYNKNSEVIKALIQLGANVNAQDIEGRSPLMCAVRSPSNEVIEFLIQSKADVNAQDYDGVTVLHLVMLYVSENPKLTELLVKAGANINARDKEGAIPLMWIAGSSSNLNLNAIKFLIFLGADKKLQDNNGKSAFDYLIKNAQAKKHKDFAQIEELLKISDKN